MNATEAQKEYFKAYREKNKDAIKARRSLHYLTNKDKYREKALLYAETHKAEMSAYRKKYYREHKESIQATRKRYYYENKESKGAQWRKALRAHSLRLKVLIINHYSLGLQACTRCGFKDIRALTIDHIDGGGGKHRKEVGNLYRWLKQNEFPIGYQVLCMNCQFIKRHEKGEFRYGD